uniref:cilia- and flagella-associated protein 36-like n=1 Tax=Styela clava TaxID=7725 RepID=UPI001939539A|nr:cilia- and flagella-associated protein 36-like [Styela clava]
MFKKERSKKSIKKENEDTSWIVEGIVAYLRSPMWTVPVLNFVEECCGEFIDSEENKFEYTEIHQRYKKMVEELLAKYMKELELTESQFSEACSINNRDIAKLDGNFEYIWAADDFLLFKRLMLKYNAEVQREALNMLQQNYAGSEKNELMYTEENTKAMDKMLKKSKHSLKNRKLQKQEKEDMELAIQFSKMEMERLNVLVEEEHKLLEEAIRLSLESSMSLSNDASATQTHLSTKKSGESISLTKPVEIGGNTMNIPQGFSASSLDSAPSYSEPADKSKVASLSPLSAFTPKYAEVKKPQPTSKSNDLPPLRTQKEMSSSEAAAAWLDGAMKRITESPTHNVNGASKAQHGAIDPAELAKRKAYLQEQRDKLLALKRKEREKQLSEYIEQKQTSDEPSTSDNKKSDTKEDKVLASRKSIAERLKNEVINKK